MISKNDREILKLAKEIKPLKRHFFGFYYFNPEDLNHAVVKGEVVEKASDLRKIATIKTYHKAVGYNFLFKPTVAEVLSQIPMNLKEHTVAFHLNSPKVVGNDVEIESYVVKTTLYGRKYNSNLPQRVRDLPVTMNGKTFSAKDIDEMHK